ncbi:SDR family oxidoreductase [Thalassobaculum sp.]|uniref:SDR family NAD(P)-dependent oxidoreductase n=1 Tax=Thalassobaculum sp. TaxID=2022740 RepID=UPI0032EF49E6
MTAQIQHAAGSLLVTGAGRGIGRGIALLAGKRGYRVAVNYGTSAEAAEDVVSLIREHGGEACAIQADVADKHAVAALFDEVEGTLGIVTALVNNAGTLPTRQTFMDTAPEDIERLLMVNVAGPLNCIRQMVQRLRSRSDAKPIGIVNISSQAAVFGGSLIAGYAASKAALNTLTVALAKELGPEGIRVNAISPGVISTNSRGPASQEFLQQIPLGREGSPIDVAEAVLWLMSPQAGYINGAIIPVSGGR